MYRQTRITKVLSVFGLILLSGGLILSFLGFYQEGLWRDALEGLPYIFIGLFCLSVVVFFKIFSKSLK